MPSNERTPDFRAGFEHGFLVGWGLMTGLVILTVLAKLLTAHSLSR